ncbi:hypothetical protein NLG97_g265 [Lecanicillium saksenae]|uniref:Uncharacterized protein n=1 Tax=Lecanicillium saksenae TaxID=468837 RepID=A0ACC1R8Y9_9HYPO|nr:hypothetical protein NLG97_g265 [Lecanicillium saksenae]
MDDHIFEQSLNEVRTVSDSASLRTRTDLEMQTPSYNINEEHSLLADEFENFLHQRGAYMPPDVPQEVQLISGIRLVVQRNASQADTFMPNVISFSKYAYGAMFRTMQLPTKHSETSAVAGPLFCHTLREIDNLARDLTECYAHALWRRPALYTALIEKMQSASRLFAKLESLAHDEEEYLTQFDTGGTSPKDKLQQLHDELVSRLEFLKAKQLSLEYYRETTLERLKLQRDTLSNILAQRDARLNIEMAKIAHAGKRDSTAMKIISLMGVLFLPGSYLASIFSMTFFDFRSTGHNVSSNVWIYVVITVPVTAALVAGWVWFERRRRVQQAKDDADFEQILERLENDIVRVVQQKSAMQAQHQTPRSYI